MSQSWSDFVLVVKPTGAKDTFHAFCEECGLKVPHCTFCFTRPEYIDSWCRECHNSWDGKTFYPQPAEKPHFTCSECDKWRDLKQIYGWEKPSIFENWELFAYSYKPYNKNLPVSPTNCIRQPMMEPVISNIPPMPLWKRHVNAWHAFNTEKNFSGNAAQALLVFTSFFIGKKPLDYSADPEKEERLSMREIQWGDKRPSNTQFLKAVIRYKEKKNKKNKKEN